MSTQPGLRQLMVEVSCTCALALLAAAAEVALTEPTAPGGYGTSGLHSRLNGKAIFCGSSAVLAATIE